MEGATRQSEAGGHRAVVWHAPGTAPPAKLTAALSQRGIEVSRVQSPFAALAELCREGRAASPAIVIVHPETLPDAGALWEAKSRYVPGARFWMYGPASNPTLRAIVASDVEGWGPPRRPEIVVRPQPGPADEPYRIAPRREPAPPRAPAGPRLKLTGEPLPAPPPAAEELRMLLGEDEPGAAEQR